MHDKSVSSGLDKFTFCRGRLKAMSVNARGENGFAGYRIIAAMMRAIEVF